MRKYKVLFSITMVMGTFSEIIECESPEEPNLRKALQARIAESGIQADGKIPQVREILIVEPISVALNSVDNDEL